MCPRLDSNWWSINLKLTVLCLMPCNWALLKPIRPQYGKPNIDRAIQNYIFTRVHYGPSLSGHSRQRPPSLIRPPYLVKKCDHTRGVTFWSEGEVIYTLIVVTAKFYGLNTEGSLLQRLDSLANAGVTLLTDSWIMCQVVPCTYETSWAQLNMLNMESTVMVPLWWAGTMWCDPSQIIYHEHDEYRCIQAMATFCVLLSPISRDGNWRRLPED